MKRFLIIFLLSVLPPYFSWAVAASYCQHENDRNTHHFGHHYHQHQGGTDRKDGAGKAPFQLHADCSVCHLGCQAALVSIQLVAASFPGSIKTTDPPDTLPSIVPEAPERPNWVPAA